MENFTKNDVASALFYLDVELGWEKKNGFKKNMDRYLKEASSYIKLPHDEWPVELVEKLQEGDING